MQAPSPNHQVPTTKFNRSHLLATTVHVLGRLRARTARPLHYPRPGSERDR
jgi:hypothetical protein